MKKTKAELEHSIEVGRWKVFLSEKVEQPYRDMVLSIWKMLNERANGKIVHVPITARMPSEDGTPYIAWNNQHLYIDVEFYPDDEKKMHIFYRDRKKDQTFGEEVNEIPDFFADMIINWKPGNDDV